MGLLDNVLGQVLGQSGIGGQMGGQTGQPGGAWSRTPGAPAPQGSGGMNVSPLVMALLALVASRTLSQGAGGWGSKLHDLITGGAASAGPTPEDSGVTGEPTTSGRVGQGGFLDQIGGMLGGANQNSGTGSSGGASDGLGGLVGGGLGGLLERFAQNGHGDTMQSWLGSGPNHEMSPDQLDDALGSGTVDDLSRRTGMERGDLLSQLSQALPQVVDRLTPHGRVPSADEEKGWV